MFSEVQSALTTRPPRGVTTSFFMSKLRYPEPLDVAAIKEVVWRGFMGHKDRPFLYRADVGMLDHKIVTSILVRSTVAPNWSALHDTAHIVEDKFSLPIEEGNEFSFDVRAHPNKSLTSPTRDRSRKVPLKDESEQLAWLGRQGDRLGFEVVESRIREASKLLVRRTQNQVKKGKGDGWHYNPVVNFAGRLRVTDPIDFRTALSEGIGKGKAYGLGMLVLLKS